MKRLAAIVTRVGLEHAKNVTRSSKLARGLAMLVLLLNRERWRTEFRETSRMLLAIYIQTPGLSRFAHAGRCYRRMS